MAGENRAVYAKEFFTGREGEQLRELAQVANGVLQGKTNNYFSVTLTPDETETTTDVEFASVGSVAQLTPQSESASAAQGVWAEVQAGVVRIHHDASPETDRIFAMVVLG